MFNSSNTKSKSKSKSANTGTDAGTKTKSNTTTTISTASTLPKSASTTFTPAPKPPVLPRSATTIFTPFQTATSVPKAVASTLYTGLKTLTTPVATAIGLRKKQPRMSRTAKMFANVRMHEDIDEWQEIDKRAVREEMREERAKMRRTGGGVGGANVELGESEDESEEEIVGRKRKENEEEVHPLQRKGRKRFRSVYDSDEEGEVVEVDGVPVGSGKSA